MYFSLFYYSLRKRYSCCKQFMYGDIRYGKLMEFMCGEYLLAQCTWSLSHFKMVTTPSHVKMCTLNVHTVQCPCEHGHMTRSVLCAHVNMGTILTAMHWKNKKISLLLKCWCRNCMIGWQPTFWQSNNHHTTPTAARLSAQVWECGSLCLGISPHSSILSIRCTPSTSAKCIHIHYITYIHWHLNQMGWERPFHMRVLYSVLSLKIPGIG